MRGAVQKSTHIVLMDVEVAISYATGGGGGGRKGCRLSSAR